MSRKNKTIISLLTGTLLLSAVVVPLNSFASINDDQAKLDALKQRSQQRATEIANLKNQESTLNQRITLVNQQIEETQSFIDSLQAEIDKTAEKIAALQVEIKKTQEHIDSQNQLLGKRIRVMYEAGDVSYMQVLLASTDFSDFVDRLSTLSFIVQQDKQLVQEIKQEKERLATTKAQLQSEQNASLAKQANLGEAKALMESQRSQQQTMLAGVQMNRKEQEAHLKKEQDEENAIEASIAAQVAAQLAAQQGRTVKSAGSWTWPVPSSHTITSGYGMRGAFMHKGIDIGAPLGTPIVAVDNGIVLFAGAASGFGHWVVIKHANGLMSVYGHMYSNGLLVSVGQEVKRGQQIATVGSDGESSGPHLHFSVATGISGSQMLYIDPSPYLGL